MKTITLTDEQTNIIWIAIDHEIDRCQEEIQKCQAVYQWDIADRWRDRADRLKAIRVHIDAAPRQEE